MRELLIAYGPLIIYIGFVLTVFVPFWSLDHLADSDVKPVPLSKEENDDICNSH